MENKQTLLMQLQEELQNFVDLFGIILSQSAESNKQFVVHLNPDLVYDENKKDYVFSLVAIVSYVSTEQDTTTRLLMTTTKYEDMSNLPDKIKESIQSVKLNFINQMLFGKHNDQTLVEAIMTDAFKVVEDETN